MPRQRKRHLIEQIKKAGKFWPAVGILGPRQCGKSTLLRDLFDKGGTFVSLDDESSFEDATLSAKNFLAKLPRPLTLDEVQKVPKLFDALKFEIDQGKRPGLFFLTGSTQFSARLGIRESLTGRIGLLYLYPMTLAEAHARDFEIGRAAPIHGLPVRFKVADALGQFASGGLPVPLFSRDPDQIKSYFLNWTETSVLRDAARAYGTGYSPDRAHSILGQLGRMMLNGDWPRLQDFKENSRTLRRYLQAFEDIFFLQKIAPHEDAVGTEAWLPTDTGIASSLMGGVLGEGASLTLGRIFVLKEILAVNEYAGQRIRPLYFKTARGAPVDLIWKGTPIKVSTLPQSRFSYDLRPLESAVLKLKAKQGILAVPHDITLPKKVASVGISIVPWTYWS